MCTLFCVYHEVHSMREKTCEAKDKNHFQGNMSALGGGRVGRSDGKLSKDFLMEGLCTLNRTSLLIKREWRRF